MVDIITANLEMIPVALVALLVGIVLGRVTRVTKRTYAPYVPLRERGESLSQPPPVPVELEPDYRVHITQWPEEVEGRTRGKAVVSVDSRYVSGPSNFQKVDAGDIGVAFQREVGQTPLGEIRRDVEAWVASLAARVYLSVPVQSNTRIQIRKAKINIQPPR
jgi:hypothetical protein